MRLVVIDNLNVIGVATFPPEQNAPLIVDSDRVVTGKPSFLWLQPVPGWSSQIHEFGGIMQVQQLASCRPFQLRRKLAHLLRSSVIKQIFGKPIAKTLDHCSDVIIYR